VVTGEAKGRFIAFEGGEGCGKSTQARLLAERIDAVLTREPGGTPIGTEIRGIVLAADDNGLVDRAEALLMAADRAQHVATVVRPALAAGRHVVTDRYLPSSVAYQGAGRGLGADTVRGLSQWATEDLVPDLVVLLAVTETEARARIGSGGRDRLEKAGADLHAAVARSYAEQAAADPDHWVVLDGGGTVAEVQVRVDAALSERLGL
jgi:dTMP kinase